MSRSSLPGSWLAASKSLDQASRNVKQRLFDRAYAVAQMRSFPAVLYLLLCFVFALYECKNETQNKTEGTMLPQANRRCVASRKYWYFKRSEHRGATT